MAYDDAREQAEQEAQQRIRREFPDWRPWSGVGDTGWYASRIRTSPPKVMRADSAAELLEDLRTDRRVRLRAESAARLKAEMAALVPKQRPYNGGLHPL